MCQCEAPAKNLSECAHDREFERRIEMRQLFACQRVLACLLLLPPGSANLFDRQVYRCRDFLNWTIRILAINPEDKFMRRQVFRVRKCQPQPPEDQLRKLQRQAFDL